MSEQEDSATLRARISALVHDARGPLTVILSYAEMLEEGTLEREPAIEAARTIRTNAERLAKLIDAAALK